MGSQRRPFYFRVMQGYWCDDSPVCPPWSPCWCCGTRGSCRHWPPGVWPPPLLALGGSCRRAAPCRACVSGPCLSSVSPPHFSPVSLKYLQLDNILKAALSCQTCGWSVVGDNNNVNTIVHHRHHQLIGACWSIQPLHLYSNPVCVVSISVFVTMELSVVVGQLENHAQTAAQSCSIKWINTRKTQPNIMWLGVTSNSKWWSLFSLRIFLARRCWPVGCYTLSYCLPCNFVYKLHRFVLRVQQRRYWDTWNYSIHWKT